MRASNSPIVTEVLRFEDLPAGSRGTRRAIARWSDGTESEALTWYADEILICEGDLIGKTQPTPLRALPQRPRLAPVLASDRASPRKSEAGPTAPAPSPKRARTPR
jgi:hypothetical protein